jgi:hypothetical protein
MTDNPDNNVVPIGAAVANVPKSVLGTNVDNTLKERASNYGTFKSQTAITRALKRAMHAAPGWEKLTDSQMEALDMIAVKAGRILNGNPNHADGWHDISGYAKLVENEINGILV